MIVTGETSGELYGSLLATSLKKRLPSVRIIGVGGELMKAAGVELISGFSSAFGAAELISSLSALRETFKRAVDALVNQKPSVLILIDYPDFNLKLAEEAGKQRISILYYVSPQVWAWRKKRVHRIARLVDRMAVILPFEEEIYQGAGLRTEFVGHPVMDEIHRAGQDRIKLKRELGLQEDAPVIALLPGSRPHELQRLLPLLLNVFRESRKEFSTCQFCMPFAPNTDLSRHEEMVRQFRAEGAVITKGESLRVLAVSDLAVIASGTASLQAALLGIPLIVIYKLFPLTYWLARLIVKVKYVSLVNILSGRGVVREFIQGEATAGNIMQEIRRIMSDTGYREAMLASFEEVRRMFEGRNASERVAEIVMEMGGWK